MPTTTGHWHVEERRYEPWLKSAPVPDARKDGCFTMVPWIRTFPSLAEAQRSHGPDVPAYGLWFEHIYCEEVH